MHMTIEVLKNYKIDIHDLVVINMIIEEVKYVQIQCDYLASVKHLPQ